MKKFRRRAFLKSTAAVAILAGNTLPGARGAKYQPSPPPRRIRVGFLGASHSHALEKMRITRGSPDWELVGIAEDDPEVRRRYEEMNVPMLSSKKLLEGSEAIAVESAVRDHARLAKLALEAGKHVHVEKPPATKLEDLREILDLAKARKLLVQVGYMWRYHPGFLAIFEAARKGWLGEVYMVRAAVTTLVAADRRPEWAEFAGGAFFELGSHLLDATVRLLGRPGAVTPFLRKHGKFDDRLADNNLVALEFPGALAVITNTALQPNAGSHRSFEVLGTNGTAILRPIEPPTLVFDLAKAAGPYVLGPQAVSLPAYRRYERDLAELARAIRGECALSVTAEEELLVEETLLRASGME